MSLIVNLENNVGYKWYVNKDNSIYVKGYLFFKNTLYQDQKLLNFIENYSISEENNILNDLVNFNGSFSIIFKQDKKVYAIVDRLRSFPLFYKFEDKQLSLTDKISLESTLNKQVKSESSESMEFLLSGYTINDSTLLDNYKQLTASEVLVYEDNSINIQKYFLHTHQDYLFLEEDEHFKNLNKITKDFTLRLIESVKEKTIVVPLSGGYDSRYILSALYKANVKNVICYTYGKENSFEVDIAKKVALALDYPIHIIEYNSKKWENLKYDIDFLDYIDYSFNFSSLPHIQDFIALKELKSILPKNSVIVPGFCGDVLGGSYVPIEVKEDKTAKLLEIGLSEYIIKKHFKNLNINFSKDKIKTKIDINNIESIEDFISINENFLTEHRLSKFIINSLRVYEFFGFEWRMPLWDNELIDYWYRVPYQERIGKKLYHNYLFNNMFDEKIAFKKPKPKTQSKPLMFLRRVLPLNVLTAIKKIYFSQKTAKKDINDFNSFERELLKDIKDIEYLNVNGLFAYWLLNYYVKKGFLK